MNPSLLDILECPICHSTRFDFKVLGGSATDIEEGITWCENQHWFTIEDRVLEFLSPDLRYQEDRTKFQDKHGQELRALGLLGNENVSAYGRTQDELNLIQIQQHHFDWYAESQEQAYDSYGAMPFWRVVDKRTFTTWNVKIQAQQELAGEPRLLLDVGCAQGRSALLVAQPGVRVIGFDISKRMVRRAYLNFRGAPSGPRENDFIVADGSHFPFRSGVFDYALVYGVLHHLPDPAAACREIVRVLKAGGTYFGCENNRTVFRRVFDLLQRVSPAWHEEAGKQPLMSFRDLAHWFNGTGLTIRTSSTVFVPPHLVNALGIRAGGYLLAAIDSIFRAVPFFRNQGGLILVEGMKS